MEFAILLLIALISKFGDVCMSHNIVEGCEGVQLPMIFFSWYFKWSFCLTLYLYLLVLKSSFYFAWLWVTADNGKNYFEYDIRSLSLLISFDSRST